MILQNAHHHLHTFKSNQSTCKLIVSTKTAVALRFFLQERRKSDEEKKSESEKERERER